MKTINSLSGGKTSSYIAANYPADYNIFSLVRTDDKEVMFPDVKVRQMVSDRIGKEFIGTLEEDTIIYTMLDLEQYIGQEIIWLSDKTFEEVIQDHNEYLPNKMSRFCTVDMKVKPIAQWCYENTDLPVEMRIGFRANEMRRAKNMIERTGANGIETFKFRIGKHKNGNNKWKELEYRKTTFPLIEDGLFKDTIEEYWKDKPVRFAYMNNCVGCFHRSQIFLKHMSNKAPKQFEWFAKQEREVKGTFKTGTTYDKIKNHRTQLELFDTDFNECDSGYCGL
jgi:hypothetical protein